MWRGSGFLLKGGGRMNKIAEKNDITASEVNLIRKICGEDFINIQLNSPIDPCIITPVGSDNYIYLFTEGGAEKYSSQ